MFACKSMLLIRNEPYLVGTSSWKSPLAIHIALCTVCETTDFSSIILNFVSWLMQAPLTKESLRYSTLCPTKQKRKILMIQKPIYSPCYFFSGPSICMWKQCWKPSHKFTLCPQDLFSPNTSLFALFLNFPGFSPPILILAHCWVSWEFADWVPTGGIQLRKYAMFLHRHCFWNNCQHLNIERLHVF